MTGLHTTMLVAGFVALAGAAMGPLLRPPDFPRGRGGDRSCQSLEGDRDTPIRSSRTLRCDEPSGGRIALSEGSRGEPTNRKARRCFSWLKACGWSTPTRT